jgi:predicted MFS family arabinose efflux permease
MALPQVSREVWLLCLATGLINAGYLSMMGLLKTIFVLRLGYDADFVGTIMAAGSLSFALSSLLGGILGGRFGARRMMIAGAAVVAGGMALLPLTEFVPQAVQPLWPPLVQVVTSTGWAWVAVNLVPALTVFSLPENRRDAYGLKEAAAGLGMFLGAIVGGLLPAFFAAALHLSLDTPAPYRYALMASVLVALAALIPVTRVSDVPRLQAGAATPVRASVAALRPFAGLILAALLNHAAVASSRVFYPAYLDRVFFMPTALIGVIASIGTLLAVVGSLNGPRVIGSRSSGFGMIVASLGLTASLLLMGLFEHRLAAAIGTIGTLALIGLWTLAYQVLQMEMAEPAQRSLVAGVGWMGMSLGFTVMSFAGGQIVTAYGYQPLFLVGALLSAASAVVMWRIAHRRAGLQPARSR